MITHPVYIVITTVALAMPPSSDGVHAAGHHLVGIALLIAERDREGRWRFARRVHAIPAGEPEGTLLEWTAARLPSEAMLIGWNVDHGLVPVLLNAAETAPATVADRFLRQLVRLLGGGVVDMALEHGGAGAPALAAVAADMAIYAPVWNVDAINAAWAIGTVDQVRRDLADEALAIWRLFIRAAGTMGMEAEVQTDAWITRRQRLSISVGTPAQDEQQQE